MAYGPIRTCKQPQGHSESNEPDGCWKKDITERSVLSGISLSVGEEFTRLFCHKREHRTRSKNSDYQRKIRFSKTSDDANDN
jgi:hypothetical protein